MRHGVETAQGQRVVGKLGRDVRATHIGGKQIAGLGLAENERRRIEMLDRRITDIHSCRIHEGRRRATRHEVGNKTIPCGRTVEIHDRSVVKR